MSGTCTPLVMGASIATIIVAALFIAHFVKLKKAIQAKKPIPFPNMTTQVFVYIFLAGACINVLQGLLIGHRPLVFGA